MKTYFYRKNDFKNYLFIHKKLQKIITLLDCWAWI